MSDCPPATNGADKVRKLQRALSRTSKQDKKRRFYSLYAKRGRAAVLWEAWRQGQANKGAPGVEGMASEWSINPGYAEERSPKLPQALREQRAQFAPVRVVEIPNPKGGTRPLGIAPVEDRGVQTARRLVVAPLFEADVHDCSYGYRPKRDAPQASLAMRADLDHRAWRVGVGHMTQDTCGKPYLPILPRAFKAQIMSAEVPRSSKESWCPSMAIRLA